MNILTDLIQNPVFLSAGGSWLAAQVSKIIYESVRNGFHAERLTGGGGMPSSHSATVTGLTVGCLLAESAKSPAFAIALFMAMVVIYDAMGVRLETGKQAQVINEMFELLDRLTVEDLSMDVKLKEFVGHTPMQVVAGCVLGMIVAFCSYNFF